MIIRFYLVVELFVGLQDAPAGAYQDVQWTNFIPISKRSIGEV